MIKLVIFDWNGVLIADAHACMDADNYILKVFGGKKVDFKEYQDTIIIPSIDFYVQHGCSRAKLLREHTRWGKLFHAYYEKRAAKVRTRTNARKLLLWLSKNGVESIILSNHTVSGISAQLKRLKIRPFFSKLLANEEKAKSMEGRNKGRRLEIVLKKCRLKKSEVLIIGDSPEEIEIGRKEGIVTVGITGGYYATWRLKAAKPDYLISDVGQLIGIIKKS